MPNTVKLKKYVDIINEKVASATITPGMLVMIDGDGKVKPHNDAAGPGIRMVALEDELQGNTMDDDYSDGDPVQCWTMVSGEEAYMIFEDDNDVSVGDRLVSNGEGALKPYTDDDDALFIALEDLDLTGDSSAESSEEPLGTNRRIKVMAI